MSTLLLGIYMLAVAGLSLLGAWGLVTLRLYWRHRHDYVQLPPLSDGELPAVTVQLPIYNERYVVERLVHAAAALNYPADRLQIQIIDDSTDDTTDTATALVDHYRGQGLDISLLHRRHRQGFKAGALRDARLLATGEFLAIFDADFQPPADFLRQTVPYFVRDERLGMVQARWGHLNPDTSALTAVQVIALDKHFAMEQTVRFRANLFPKFNGAAGVWRQSCLIDAGGWQDDTVCEDLCLSTRAILKGWRFEFLPDVVAPAELPTLVSAYKNQQARWAKGSLQCLLKYGRAILTDHRQSLVARCYALLAMASYSSHILLIMLLLVQLPLMLLDQRPPRALMVLSLFGLAQPFLFVLAQQTLYPDWIRQMRYMPALLLVAVGMGASISRALLETLVGRPHLFVRTPKGLDQMAPAVSAEERATAGTYIMSGDRILLVEIALALYALISLIVALGRGDTGNLVLPAIGVASFGYVAYLGIREDFYARRR